MTSETYFLATSAATEAHVSSGLPAEMEVVHGAGLGLQWPDLRTCGSLKSGDVIISAAVTAEEMVFVRTWSSQLPVEPPGDTAIG